MCFITLLRIRGNLWLCRRTRGDPDKQVTILTDLCVLCIQISTSPEQIYNVTLTKIEDFFPRQPLEAFGHYSKIKLVVSNEI